MDQLTVKQLQQKCKDAGLKTSGSKQTLVERLNKYHIAKPQDNDDLKRRLQQLEQTIARLEANRTNIIEDESTAVNAAPLSTSSPTSASNLVNSSDVVTNNLQVPYYTSSNMVPPSITRLVSSVQVPFQVTSTNVPHSLYNASVPHCISSQNLQQPVITAQLPYQISPAMMPQSMPFYMPQLNNHAQMQYCPEPPRMDVREIAELLPEFNPTSDESLSSSQFVQRVNILKNVYNWRDDVLLAAVQRKCKGHAKLWIDGQRDVVTVWQNFAEKLQQTFPFDVNAATAHVKMDNTKQNSNESPRNYYFKMLAMGNKFGLAENEITRHIINGVNDSDLRKKISNQYVCCADLLRDIEVYCQFNEVKVTRKEKSKLDGTESNAAIAQKGTNSRIKCYNCNKYGHMAASCTEPKRAARESNGKSVQEGKKHQVNEVAIEVDEKPDILKNIVVNGQSFQAFVDPGSAKTLIRTVCAEKVGEIAVCNLLLSGFGGGQYQCKGKLPALVVMDGHETKTDLLVVENDLLKYDVLVGRDVLCQQGKRVVIEEDTCWLENVENAMTRANSLDKDENQKLQTLIISNRSCFAENIYELGACSVKKMSIKLKSTEPINVKPYRIAFSLREKVRDMISELLQAEIIRPSSSPFASPVVIVPKKNNELRLCVDYRLINRITVKEPFPMPIIEEYLAKLAGSKFFTTMDMRMGYHQIEIEESSKMFTAFVTTEGHYEYNRMPFGLVNAPAVFQSIMTTIVSQMEPGEIMAYLDDVIIPSKSAEEGLRRLEKFFKIIRKSGLTLRLDKCNFLATEIEYLGHVINANGITPGRGKVRAIENFTKPTNVTEVRRFLGLTGFFRKFIRNYAQITGPLNMLLRKSEENNFKWEEPQEKAFHELVKALCEKPVLALYDFHASHELHTDASAHGLAGVLLQSTNDKDWRAVFYFSRRCTDAESRYHSYELETLALVESLSRFRIFLLGKPFRAVTDCSAIAKAKEKKELMPKISRWYLKLLEFDMELVHRGGQQLAHVDALSRSPNEPPCEVEPAGFIMNIQAANEDWLLTMQLQDQKLADKIAILKGEKWSEEVAQVKTDYKLQNSRLYRKTTDGLKLVVPKNVRWRIIKTCHDDAGHFGLEKTIERVKQHFWFPRIRKCVREYLAACIECCYFKAQGGKSEGRLHFATLEPIPFAVLHLDHLGPFTKSKRGMCYSLIIADAFSKYVLAKAVRNTKTGPVLAALNELTSYFGLPKRVVTDRGTAFTSKVFEEYCKKNAIQHIKVAVRSPRANGQVERANRLILSCLRTKSASGKDWDLELREIQFAINSQKNATSGYTPNELIFDFSLRDISQNHILAAVHDDIQEVSTVSIQEKRQNAAERIEKERSRWKQRFDSSHKQPTVYEINDLVVVAYEPAATGDSRKLEPKFRGPYMIAKVLGNDRYVVTDVPGMQITQRKFDSVFAADKLKKWCSDYPELDNMDNTEENDDSSEDDA